MSIYRDDMTDDEARQAWEDHQIAVGKKVDAEIRASYERVAEQKRQAEYRHAEAKAGRGVTEITEYPEEGGWLRVVGPIVGVLMLVCAILAVVAWLAGG